MRNLFAAALLAFGVCGSALAGSTQPPYSAPLANVTARAPHATDGIGSGYLVGDWWVTPNDTRAWTNLQNNAGFSNWQAANFGSQYPVDGIGGTTPLSCWGTKRLKASYTGPLVNVESPTALAPTDIGSIAGGDIDRNALWSVMGTAGYVLVDGEYDQCGATVSFTGSISGTAMTLPSSATLPAGSVINGTGVTFGTTVVSGSGTSYVITPSQTEATVEPMTASNELTMTATANMPKMTPTGLLGNSAAIVFDGTTQGTATSTYLNIPTSVTVASGTPISFVALASDRDAAQNSPVFSLLNTTSSSYPMNFGVSAVSGFFQVTGVSQNLTIPYVSPVSPFVAGAVLNNSTSTIWLNDLQGTGTLSRLYVYTGGYLGKFGTGSDLGGYTDISELLLYSRVLSTADIANANLLTYRYFGATPQAKDVLECDGDSLTESYLTTLNQTWPKQMSPFLAHPFTVYDTGGFGQTSTQRYSYLQSRLSSYFNTPSGVKKILIEFSGTNDVTSAASGSAIYATTSSIVSYAHSLGWQVILVDMLPRSNFPTGGSPAGAYETIRLAYNALVVANSAAADGVVDVASDPTIGTYTANANTLIYGDGTHLTSLGASYLAADVANVVNTLAPN